MTGPILRNEIRLVLRRPGVFAAAALFTALCAHAGDAGQNQVSQIHASREAAAGRMLRTFEERRDRAGEVARGERVLGSAREATEAGRVNGIQLPVLLPPGPLQNLAPGNSPVQPAFVRAGLFASSADLFQRQEIDDPEGLMFGSLDFSLILVAILPLLVLFLFYDLLAFERDRRLLPGLVTQSGSLAALSGRKILVRCAALAAILLLGCIAAALPMSLLAGPVALSFLLCIAAAFSYAAFWVSLSFLVVSQGWRREVNAAALLLLWLILIALLPGVIDLFARFATDSGARIREVAARRQSTALAEREGAKTLEEYLFEHPELAEADERDRWGSKFFQQYYAVIRSVDSITLPAVEERMRQARKRDRLVARAAYLAPPALLHQTLMTLAGTDPARFRRFQEEARNYLANIQMSLADPLWTGTLLTPADFDALPRFAFREKTELQILMDAAPPILFLALLSGLLSACAVRRLRSYPLL